VPQNKKFEGRCIARAKHEGKNPDFRVGLPVRKTEKHEGEEKRFYEIKTREHE